MADTPVILDPDKLFHRDSHGAALAQLNRPFRKEEAAQEPPKHQDIEQLTVARKYVQDHLRHQHGHLVVERAADGNYRWVAKIQGAPRWQSETFRLTSGTFREGTRLPFKNPPSQ